MPTLLKIYGNAFIVISFVGLVIGTFELAFMRTYFQVAFRMALHMACIPVGVYILTFKNPKPPGEVNPVLRQCQLLLSVCSITVGTIGLCIAMVELGFIRMDSALTNRLWIYSGCIFVGLFWLPMQN